MPSQNPARRMGVPQPRSRVLSSLSLAVTWLGVAAAPAAAQYNGEPPVLIGSTVAFPTSFLGSGITELGQVDFTPVPGAPVGRFYACLSVRRTGGAGGWDVLAGVYDDSGFPPSFTKNDDLDALNTALDEFSASVSNDLLVVAFDSPIGAMYSVRSNPSVPFPAAQPIGDPVPPGYVDGKLCVLDGVASFAYLAGGDVWAAAFDRAAFAARLRPASNPRKVVTKPAGAAGLHSPSAVRDDRGETRAFMVAVEPTSGPWFAAFASSIHDADLPRTVVQTGTQLGYPAVVGGTTVWADKSGATWGDPLKIDFVGVNSARVPAAGGTLNLSVFVPYTFFGPPVLATAILGTLGAAPTPLPGIQGDLGLTGPVVALPLHSLPPRSTGAHYALPTPPLPAGLRVDVQAVVFDIASSQVLLGNTAVIQTR